MSTCNCEKADRYANCCRAKRYEEEAAQYKRECVTMRAAFEADLTGLRLTVAACDQARSQRDAALARVNVCEEAIQAYLASVRVGIPEFHSQALDGLRAAMKEG